MRTFAITFFFFFFFGFYTATGTENCVNSTCGANRPIIRFPFRIKDRQSDRCGYPGFELTCNDQNETILELPFSGKFRVKGIEYDAQEIRINDPDTVFRGDFYTLICRVFEKGFSRNLSHSLRLTWDEPNCKDCKARGGNCRFKSNTGPETGYCVAPRRGLPRSASYAIIIGVFIPALMVIIGLGCYVYGRIKGHGGQHHPNAESSSSTIYPQTNIVMMGLDGPTIESYPKLVLGESRRLPQPNDGTCPICLSEYRPKDTLKCIPECKHFFHADCIDEWLRINATCPVCRNSPQRLSPINAP
ncbi:hypothetical protein HHK36_032511 [Tetracentron sinense]|uniref:RING-type E3 ubiquitin transferase n=1 Tax=Tetracentron sinense TaxID=13715 RepID=A0A834Y926_TETSI|nr:hypothetical protein HHK36_032511 [Tetracentron sinense]